MNAEHFSFFNSHKTPFYFYDLALLKATVKQAKKEADKYGYHIHYALKANTNDKILDVIAKAGLGADCVSGNEITRAIESNFKPSKVVFAGVGKSDDEIRTALLNNIFCFNCESVQELQVINEIATASGKVASVALRINPNVTANTHHYITTGLEENKFGINIWELDYVLAILADLSNVKLIGLHFHIGSQITDFTAFKSLALKINEIQHIFENKKIVLKHINAGGGIGINYLKPDEQPMPDFAEYFGIFNQFLELRNGQQLHFELGRSLVGQCGSLISKVLYIKKGVTKSFAILDAGMTDLIRPALYQAYHKLENITAEQEGRELMSSYDVVGPVCESSDCFGKAVDLPETFRGDLIAIRSAGAYGEVMSSSYNLRAKAKAYFSDEVGVVVQE